MSSNAEATSRAIVDGVIEAAGPVAEAIDADRKHMPALGASRCPWLFERRNEPPVKSAIPNACAVSIARPSGNASGQCRFGMSETKRAVAGPSWSAIDHPL